MHPPGRLTLPRIRLLSPDFHYTPSAATNVAQAIEREKRLQQLERTHEQQRLAHSGQPSLPGMSQAPSIIRLRAGLGQVITLPDL